MKHIKTTSAPVRLPAKADGDAVSDLLNSLKTAAKPKML